MMYLFDTFKGEALAVKATEKPPFGPGFAEDQLAGVEAMEVHFSGFSDPGPDRAEYRLLDKDGNVLVTKSVDGY
jgi:hypothetical protein